MKTLDETFRKNGLDYRLLLRNDKVALFELSIDSEIAGYEVSRIYVQDSCVMPSGISYPEKEMTPSTEDFGKEGSKAFFPDHLKLASEYFISLTAKLQEGKKPAILPYDENGKLSGTVEIDNIGIPGLTSTCIERSKNVAVYKRFDGYYEVFKIQILPESEYYGKHFPKREGYPGSEDFGMTAWCFRNEKIARKKYVALVNAGQIAF